MLAVIRIILCLCVCMLLSPSANAQALKFATPLAAGFDPTRLPRIDSVIEGAIEAHEIPGAVALIVRDGAIVYFKSFGYADIDSRKQMKNDAIFRIASMTKAITTVGIMILYERGHFLLSDPVANYLPEFANPQIAVAFDGDGMVSETRPANRPIRIIDLLTHSSGIAHRFLPSSTSKAYASAGIVDGVTSMPLILKDNIKKIAEQPLEFEPGSDYRYGLNSDVLGYLLEVISGQTLDEFFRDEIFEPLGMADTFFYLPDAKAERLVTLYADPNESGISTATADDVDILLDNPNYPVEGAKTFFSGGAGLSSTAVDYARFLQMVLNGGDLDGVRVISRKSVELMTTSRIDMDDDGDPDFAMGFRVYDDLGEHTELASPKSIYWGGSFHTYYWVDPEERLIGIFMSQVRPAHTTVAKRFFSLMYQALD